MFSALDTFAKYAAIHKSLGLLSCLTVWLKAEWSRNVMRSLVVGAANPTKFNFRPLGSKQIESLRYERQRIKIKFTQVSTFQ